MHDKRGKHALRGLRWAGCVRRLADSRWGSTCWGKSWRQLHSPTLFEIGKALQPNSKHWPKSIDVRAATGIVNELEVVRNRFLATEEAVERLDLGAGSRRRTRGESGVRVADLARRSLTPKADLEAFCRWLQLVAPVGRRGRFLELGTSLGLTSAGVAMLGWEVQTWEGCPKTLELANTAWKELGLSGKIDDREGDFRILVNQLKRGEEFDVVFLDGLHEEQATLDLASALEPRVRTCLVVDDISWSPGMNRAWNALQDEPAWRVSFTWRGRGFLFKAPHMARERFRLA